MECAFFGLHASFILGQCHVLGSNLYVYIYIYMYTHCFLGGQGVKVYDLLMVLGRGVIMNSTSVQADIPVYMNDV